MRIIHGGGNATADGQQWKISAHVRHSTGREDRAAWRLKCVSSSSSCPCVVLLSVGKLLETRKTPFQREATKAISAFSIYPLPDGALTWFLYRIVAAKVTRQLIS